MSKILADTSVWIDAFNGINNKYSKILDKMIEDNSIVLCPIIIQEVLQGIKNDNYFEKVKRALYGFEVLSIDPIDLVFGAAVMYRSLRKKGITIHKSNDCQIAYYAIKHNVPLLHRDNDFNNIAKHSSLKIFPV